MKGLIQKIVKQFRRQQTRSFLGAVTFYTTIPFPRSWQLNFQQIARWAPCIGLLLGGFLGLLEMGLAFIEVPRLTRSVLIIACWIALTGGLHLDGAMDTADGLAVTARDRRLEIMRDSRTGAFGVMAAVILLLLKVAALADLQGDRVLALMGAAGWGRWGQVVAIALYPYLRPTGKGAFHKEGLQFPQDIFFGLFFLLGFAGIVGWLHPHSWRIALEISIIGCAIAILSGYWFYCQLGGHTGDTYGAVVEWTEALSLCIFAGLFNFK